MHGFRGCIEYRDVRLFTRRIYLFPISLYVPLFSRRARLRRCGHFDGRLTFVRSLPASMTKTETGWGISLTWAPGCCTCRLPFDMFLLMLETLRWQKCRLTTILWVPAFRLLLVHNFCVSVFSGLQLWCEMSEQDRVRHYRGFECYPFQSIL